MNIAVCDGLGPDLPRAGDLVTGKPLEVKLTADLQIQRHPDQTVNLLIQTACTYM